MINPSLIYAVATILLSLVEAIRFKVQWGKVKNIDHRVSRLLAIVGGALVGAYWLWGTRFSGWALLATGIVVIGFATIRLALYDPFLNLFRLWTGTNPTGRIDYVSTETSSYEDQHSEKVAFWWKRIIGVAGYFAMYFLYRLIFKV